MIHRFANDVPVFITRARPNTVTSRIEVSGLDDLTIEEVRVAFDIDHTFDRDLTISLISPDQQKVVLVDREGGSRNNFRGTTFDDDARISITQGSPPFSGIYKPEGNLSDFKDKSPNGTWTLEVRDNASLDGGFLNAWAFSIRTQQSRSPFSIDVRFRGGLSESQKAAFDSAAKRWSEIIVGNLPRARLDNGEVVDDVVIEAKGEFIDGRGRVLGQAGPTFLRPGSFLPARGIMSFDTADLAQMEEDGSLVHVIIHEMGHVLGMGTIWGRLGLLRGAGSSNPTFLGQNAIREYAAIKSTNVAVAVPVANTGGPGTRDGHWRESVFGNELMSGFLNSGFNPISRVTIAALEDMGYEVNYNAADPYSLPGSLRLAELGLRAGGDDHGGHGMMFFPDQIVLPEEAMVD